MGKRAGQKIGDGLSCVLRRRLYEADEHRLSCQDEQHGRPCNAQAHIFDGTAMSSVYVSASILKLYAQYGDVQLTEPLGIIVPRRGSAEFPKPRTDCGVYVAR